MIESWPQTAVHEEVAKKYLKASQDLRFDFVLDGEIWMS